MEKELEKKMKKDICDLYFNELKPKHLKKFTEKTPKGYTLMGYICKKANHYLGSMYIVDYIDPETEEVHSAEQFIQAMPKIHYYSHYDRMVEKNDHSFKCREKLDGSCLILFGLYDNDGKLLEVVPKTRGVPVADKHIIEIYNELDHSNIEEFFKQYARFHPTLMFELYGQLNQHSIFYPEYRISLSLLGITFDREFIGWNDVEYIAQQFDFKLPNHIFTLHYVNGFWDILINPGIYAHYLIKDMTEEQKLGLQVSYPTQLDAVTAVKDYITIINRSYFKVHKHSLLEGVVVNAYDHVEENPMFMKIKSAEIEEKCRTVEGIPRKFILKECQKYFDEYGSQAKEIYQKDDKHAYNYIMNNLSEEFDKEALENKKTKNRVKNVFLDMLEAKEPPVGLQEICNKLVEEYPGQNATDYIRLFAQEYPEKKRQARVAFSIFETLVGD